LCGNQRPAQEGCQSTTMQHIAASQCLRSTARSMQRTISLADFENAPIVEVHERQLAGDRARRCPRGKMPADHGRGVREADMTKENETTTIKKCANRRLCSSGTSTYVTLEDRASMVKAGEDFVGFDAKSGDEITCSVLTQIIFEQENKGQNLLPITFLRQLIRFYGDSMQNLVPTYLDFSIDSL